MDRKKFIDQMMLASFGLTAAAWALGCQDIQKKKNKDSEPKLADQANNLFFKLSLAQWSIHRMIFEGLSPYEFAGLAKKWGFAALEYVCQLYRDVIESKNQAQALKKFIDKNNQLAEKYNLRNWLIMVDGEGDLSTDDNTKRKEAIENHKKWIETAAAMKCSAIRVNLHGSLSLDKWTAHSTASLIKLSEFAVPYNINVLVENHGGYSSDAQKLMKVIYAVNKPNCGTLPDFGNFCTKRKGGAPWGTPCLEEYDAYKGIEEMMPKALAISAKSHAFDSEGEETKLDYARILALIKKVGYTGYIGVEYEGTKLPESEGIIATKELLMKHGSKKS